MESKLTKDIILVGFQTYEFDLYKYTQKQIDSLSFDNAIKKLEELNVYFKVFYKNENFYYELEDWENTFYYLIIIENNN